MLFDGNGVFSGVCLVVVCSVAAGLKFAQGKFVSDLGYKSCSNPVLNQ